MSFDRPCVIIGNWKMHKTLDEARAFVHDLLASYQEDKTKWIGLAVPYTLLYPLAAETARKPLKIGAQNMNDASEGAFTGEIAGSMFVGCWSTIRLAGTFRTSPSLWRE